MKDILKFIVGISVGFLILSIIMILKSINKKGGWLDSLNQNLISWVPFDFMEEHFDIQRPNKLGLTQIFQNGIREDYFYLNVSKRMNLNEEKEYTNVIRKIRSFEKKWSYAAFFFPFIMLIILYNIPADTFLKKYLDFSPMLLIYFAIHKLRLKPYKHELLSIQKKILQNIYNLLFDDNLFNEIKLNSKLTKINKVRIPSNYYDLNQIIIQIIEKKERLHKNSNRCANP